MRRLLLFGCLVAVVTAKATEVRDIVGASHIQPRYTLNLPWPGTGTRDILNEGADELLTMGTRVLKVQLNPNGKAFYHYTQNPDFPDNRTAYDPAPDVRNREYLKNSVQFQTLLHKPFKTLVINIGCNLPVLDGSGDEYARYQFGPCGVKDTGTPGYEKPLYDGFTPAEVAIEKAAMKNIARYLLETFAGSGKTFVLSTGELDWIAREPYWGDPTFALTPDRIEAMRKWLNARQDGVTEARDEAIAAGISGVQVVASAEVNLVADAVANMTTVTNDVLPWTHMDLYSYTAYDAHGDVATFIEHLNYLAAKAPDSALYGEKNIYVGEYGVSENVDSGGDAARRLQKMRRLTEAGLAWGVRYMLVWQLLENDLRPELLPPGGTKDCAAEVYGSYPLCNPDVFPTAAQLAGNWLIKPDGTRTNLYDYLSGIMNRSVTYAALRSHEGYYVSVDDGGGGLIHVSAPWTRAWERLAIVDLNGGNLTSGDSISILSNSGYFLMAQNGGGSGIEATATHNLEWETFTILKQNGSGTIGDGDSVALQAYSGHYVVAEEGGGNGELLDVNRVAVGAWERFTLISPTTCSLIVTPAATSISASASNVIFAVTPSSSMCGWTANLLTNTVSEIPIYGAITAQSGSGTTTGSVTVAMSANNGSTRTASVNIGGKTAVIEQVSTTSVGAPTGLVANTMTSTSIAVSWTSGVNATSCELWRATADGSFALLRANATSPYTDSGLASGLAYRYRARSANGSTYSGYSNDDLAVALVFTDDPLVAGTTAVKAVHLAELRQATNAIRAAAGFSAGTYTDSASSGVFIRAVHINELRTQLNAARAALGLAALMYTDTVDSSTTVRAVHLQELRAAVK